jgi:hypothetical protein
MWSRTTIYSSDEDGDSVNNYSSDEYDDSALSSEPFSSVPNSPNDSYGEETEYDKEEDDESSDEDDVEESSDEDDEATEEAKKRKRAKEHRDKKGAAEKRRVGEEEEEEEEEVDSKMARKFQSADFDIDDGPSNVGPRAPASLGPMSDSSENSSKGSS